MALETTAPQATPSAQVVGNAFVEQYYHILYNSPELAHRFYNDSSVLSRPDSNGVMTSVTTMQGINEKILSLDYKNQKTEINTADAQKSFKEGVTVLVTGCQTGKDNLKRKFAQSFFLAPQDNGYFVLNDVFRYVEDGEPLENHKADGVPDASKVPSTPEPEPTQILDPPAPDPVAALVEENQSVAKQVYEPTNQERQLVNENQANLDSESLSNGKDIPVVVESASSSVEEDTPKKSYASIVKVPKGGLGPTRVYVPTNTIRATAKKTENESPASTAPVTPEISAPSSTNAVETESIHEEEGHSIYIRNLPFNMTPAQLELEFKKFGPIKRRGVQVRNNKQQGYCFGFVEFLSLSSMNDAIQASPITIGDHEAIVEIKRTSTRVGSGRGGFPSRRGGFRSDSFRSRGNYGGSRSFGRNEYGNRGEFSGRSRGSAVHEGRGRGRGRGSGSGSDGRLTVPK